MIIYSGELEQHTIKTTSAATQQHIYPIRTCAFNSTECRALFLDKAKSGNMSMTLTISIWIVFLIDATCSTMKFIICLYGKQINYAIVRWNIRLLLIQLWLLLDSIKSEDRDKQRLFMFPRAHVLKVPSYHLDSEKHANSDKKSHKQDMQTHCIISVTFQNCQDYLWVRHIVGKDLIECSNCNRMKYERKKCDKSENQQWKLWRLNS